MGAGNVSCLFQVALDSICYASYGVAPATGLARGCGPPKRVTAREQFLLYDDGYASPCRFPHLGRTFDTAKIAILYVKLIPDFLHCVVLLPSIGVRGVSGNGTRYHIGLAKLEWNIHGL